MTVLTYRYLGDAVTVGQPLGCDPTGWPYRVEAVRHRVVREGAAFAAHVATFVTVEPWPLPSPNPSDAERDSHAAAMTHARQRAAGIVL